MRLFKYSLISLFLSSISASAFALNDNPGEAHHPIRIMPPTATSVLEPLGLSPKEVKQAYGIDKITNQGEGQTIAIIVAYDDPFAESDLAFFNQTFGLPPCTTANGKFKRIFASGTQPTLDKGWAAEIALDVEWAHAIAPAAKIYLVEAKTAMAPDLDQAIQVAINMGANVVSMSWGNLEYNGQLARDSMFNNPNVTFVASSGDSGHLASYPATSPYVISVGGTILNINYATGEYGSETAWPGSGGGLSAIEPEPNYQKRFPIPNNPNNMRAIPDVAYNAGMGIPVYNSVPDPQTGQTGWFAIGGTSAGAPQWSAIIAIAHSIAGKHIANLRQRLYRIAANQPSTNYHDITTGSNGTCDYYCQARAGYDYVTGFGTPKADVLINTLSKRSVPASQE